MDFTARQMVSVLFHQSTIRMEKIKYSHKGKSFFNQQRSSAFPHLYEFLDALMPLMTTIMTFRFSVKRIENFLENTSARAAKMIYAMEISLYPIISMTTAILLKICFFFPQLAL